MYDTVKTGINLTKSLLAPHFIYGDILFAHVAYPSDIVYTTIFRRPITVYNCI